MVIAGKPSVIIGTYARGTRIASKAIRIFERSLRTQRYLVWAVYPSENSFLAVMFAMLVARHSTDKQLISRQWCRTGKLLLVYWQTSGQLSKYPSFWKVRRLEVERGQGRKSLNGRGEMTKREKIISLIYKPALLSGASKKVSSTGTPDNSYCITGRTSQNSAHTPTWEYTLQGGFKLYIS